MHLSGRDTSEQLVELQLCHHPVRVMSSLAVGWSSGKIWSLLVARRSFHLVVLFLLWLQVECQIQCWMFPFGYRITSSSTCLAKRPFSKEQLCSCGVGMFPFFIATLHCVEIAVVFQSSWNRHLHSQKDDPGRLCPSSAFLCNELVEVSKFQLAHESRSTVVFSRLIIDDSGNLKRSCKRSCGGCETVVAARFLRGVCERSPCE